MNKAGPKETRRETATLLQIANTDILLTPNLQFLSLAFGVKNSKVNWQK